MYLQLACCVFVSAALVEGVGEVNVYELLYLWCDLGEEGGYVRDGAVAAFHPFIDLTIVSHYVDFRYLFG